MKTLGLELGLVWNQALGIAPQSGWHQLCNLFENNDTTTRTFSSTTIQQREPFWARYNTKNLFEHNNTTTSIVGRQVKSLWIGTNISWVHLGLNVINKHCLYQNTDCTLGVHCPYTTYFLLFTVQPCDYWQYTVCDVIFRYPDDQEI